MKELKKKNLKKQGRPRTTLKNYLLKVNPG